MTLVLQIQLLGNFRLVYGDQPVTSIEAPRLQALLAYLLLHRDAPQSRQRLAFLLYPDSSEAQARTNLRNLVHLLRKALPNADRFLIADAQTLQWNWDSPFTFDVDEFEKSVAQASSSTALREAVRLYGGELLPGCYDDWVLPERERLLQKFVESLERLILLLENQRDYRGAISYAERLLRQDALREETYRHLMRLYALSGDNAGARRVYQTCVAVLKRELDAEPSPETRAEFERLAKKDARSDKDVLPNDGRTDLQPLKSVHVTPNNLPGALTSFVGREQQIVDLKRLLSLQNVAPSRTRLLTFTGAGGSGKTRLAIQVANDLLASFKDGVWFVDLSPLVDPALIPQAIASTLGVHEQSGHGLLDTLLDYLHGKELLLILDNCEQFVAACAEFVQTLLQKGSRLQILATSRERLNLAGETVWLVPVLSLPDADSAEWMDAPHSEAVRLFVERAASALPTFALTRQNAPVVAQICRRLDGIPLAIELAAARIKVLTPMQIAARLDDSFRLLTRGSHAAPPRQQTLRAALDWSYELLSAPEQMLFRRLSVFVGGFTLESAEQVCGDDERRTTDDEEKLDIRPSSRFAERNNVIRPNEVLDLLSDLVDKSLVVVAAWDEGEQVRYRMLEPIRQYASEKLSEGKEEERVRDRHLAFTLTLAEKAELEFQTANQVHWLNRLETEKDNLRGALEWSVRNLDRSERGLRLAIAVSEFWITRGYSQEGKNWLQDLVAKGASHTDVPAKVRVKSILQLGWLNYWLAEYNVAAQLAREAVTSSQEIESTELLAFALLLQAHTDWRQGAMQEAEAHTDQSLALFREINHKWGIIKALSHLQEVKPPQIATQKQRIWTEEMLELSQELGNKEGVVNALATLGIDAAILQDYLHAIPFFVEALSLSQEIGLKRMTAVNLLWLGKIARWQGDNGKAIQLLRESLGLRRDIGDPGAIAWTLNDLGISMKHEGKCEKAAVLLNEGLTLARQVGLDGYAATIQCSLGDVAIAQGDHEEATKSYQDALIQFHKATQSEYGTAEILQRIAMVAAARGQPERAACLFGVIAGLRETFGTLQTFTLDRVDYDHDLISVRGQLDEMAFAKKWEEGRTMTLEQAIEYALEKTTR